MNKDNELPDELLEMVSDGTGFLDTVLRIFASLFSDDDSSSQGQGEQ